MQHIYTFKIRGTLQHCLFFCARFKTGNQCSFVQVEILFVVVCRNFGFVNVLLLIFQTMPGTRKSTVAIDKLPLRSLPSSGSRSRQEIYTFSCNFFELFFVFHTFLFLIKREISKFNFKGGWILSNLTLWEPVHDMMTLRQAIEPAFDDTFTPVLSESPVRSPTSPRRQLYQDPRRSRWLKPMLLKLKADDVRISVASSFLTPRGEFNARKRKGRKPIPMSSNGEPHVEHCVTLPTNVRNRGRAEADFQRWYPDHHPAQGGNC